jgi:hypothetical protein
MVNNAENSIINLSKKNKNLQKAKREAVDKALRDTRIEIIHDKKESD